MLRALAFVVALAASTAAAATPKWVIRIATVAPDGTEWARLAHNFSREVEQATNGDVAMKWYFGGIAGDELGMIDRIRRGQIDGAASGGMMCSRLAPSLRVVRIVGLFQSRDEALYVLGRLKPRLDGEFASSGYINLGEAGFGTDILFSRTPIRTFDALKHTKLWIWDLDEVYRTELSLLGLDIVPLPVESALPAYEAGRVDGFIGIDTAALAYQWSSRARYFSPLHFGYLMGCLVVSHTAFDPLPVEAQQQITAAAGKLMRQMEEMGQRQDAALEGTLFERQGMKRVDVPPSLRSSFLEAAKRARAQLGEKLVPAALLNEVAGWLADYRSEQHR